MSIVSKLLIIASGLLVGLNGYAAINPTELRIDIDKKRCKLEYGSINPVVDIYVPKKYDLAVQEIANEIVSAAYAKVLIDCPYLPGTRQYSGDMRIYEEGRDLWDLRCHFWKKEISCGNNEAISRRHQEQEDASRRAKELAAKEAQRQRESDAEARMKAFAEKNGVNGGWVDWEQLRANPFSYKGKILLFIVRFERMISPTSGIFNDMIITGLPHDTFLKPRTVLLAARVTGTFDIKNQLGGTEQVPAADYVNHLFCDSASCMDLQLQETDSRFQDNGNGTVTDLATGLIWKQCAEGLSGAGCTAGSVASFTWAQALQRAADADFAGSALWRLPNKEELASLVESRYDANINARFFPNTPATWFWSSLPNAVHPSFAWIVDFGAGGVDGYSKDLAGHVRLVRGGQ